MKRVDCRSVDKVDPGVYYVHPNAVTTGECSSGCCDDYECPDCGTRWRQELPD